ncbi:MAG: hydrogenase 3 maturation protease [Candidatus Bathyarchaeota archaeon BA1]|nr:MAG: hydrogenase 3 maturation protease [Candidatus Bathyarchaeota archaeon BA1]
MIRDYTINEKETEGRLRDWLLDARRVVVAGVGSSLRRDDFIGVKVVRGLRNKVSSFVYLIECETVPESFIEPIIEFKPTHVLIIDAALLGLKAGAFNLVEPEQLVGPIVSTHFLPLQIFCDYLAKTTGAKIALLAIQPKDTSFGEGLTPELEKAAEYLTDFLLRALP